MIRKRLIVLAAMVVALAASSAAQTISLTPNSAAPGTSVLVRATSSQPLIPASTITFTPPGLTVSDIESVPAPAGLPMIQFTITVAPNAAPGPYTLIYSARADQRTQPGAFTVVAPPAPDPYARSVSPDTVVAGDPPITVQILGAGFSRNPSVAVTGPGVTATVVSATESAITATFAAASTAPPGPRTLIVTNADGKSSRSQRSPLQITVLPPRPAEVVVRAIRPESITAGEPAKTVQIFGAGFQAGASVAIGNGEVTTNVVSVAADTITVSVAAGRDVPPGPRKIVVTNRDGNSNARRQGEPTLNVLPAAAPVEVVIERMTPASVEAGAPPRTIQVTGAGFQRNARFTVSGTGVEATLLSRTETSAQLSVTAAANATPGPRAVTVTNPDGSGNQRQQPPAVLTVTPPTAPSTPIPPRTRDVVIRALSPGVLQAGTSLPAVQVTGAGFQQGAKFTAGGDVEITTVAIVNESTATVVIAAAAKASAGPRTVIVTNPDGSSNAQQQPPAQITVLAAREVQPPQVQPKVVSIRSITPSSFVAGQGAVMARVAGTGFQNGARLELSGAGVTAMLVSVQDDGNAVAQFTIGPDATPGPRDVRIVNPDGSSNQRQTPPAQIVIAAREAPVVEKVTIDAIRPNAIVAGEPPAVLTLAGTGFKPGAKLEAGTGVTATVVAVASSTAATIQVAATRAATPGARPLIWTNADGSGNSGQQPPALLTVSAPKIPPVISAIVPPSTNVGEPTAVSITGTGFQPGAQLTLEGTDASFTGVTIVSPTSAKATLTSKKNAKPGLRVVMLRNPDGLSTEAQSPSPKVMLAAGYVLLPVIDNVSPPLIEPGKQYKLTLTGKNLTPDAKVAFGDGVTIVGALFLSSPTTGTLDVLVSSNALVGKREARISNAQGMNAGPGSVNVAAIAPTSSVPPQTKPPGVTKLPPPAEKKVVPKTKVPDKPAPGTIVPGTKPGAELGCTQSIGMINLLHPCEPADKKWCPDGGGMLTPSTEFAWSESNPGVAKLFVIEFIDQYKNVLQSAQTAKPTYKLPLDQIVALAKFKTSGEWKGQQTTSGGSKGSGNQTTSGALQGSAPSAPKGTGAVAKIAPAVYWRVRGLAPKNCGGSKEMIDVEWSEIRQLDLPQAPNGFSCPAPGKSKIGPITIQNHPNDKTPAPCNKKDDQVSDKHCSGFGYATISPKAFVDLSDVPFELGQKGDLGSSFEVTFQNVYVDWGDKSEPVRLTTVGGDSKSLEKVFLNDLEMYHQYKNPKTAKEFETYTVRVYAVADSDNTLPYQYAGAAGGGANTTLGPSPQVTGGVQSLGSSALPTAGGGSVAVEKTIYTIACADVRVYNPIGEGALDPLTILSAEIRFPTDGVTPSSSGKSSQGSKTGGAGGNVQGAGAVSGKPVSAPQAGGGAFQDIGIPNVSDCAETFRPSVRIIYSGTGKARVSWRLDKTKIGSVVVMLPPVSVPDAKSKALPYVLDLSSALPTVLQKAPHEVDVRVEAGEAPPAQPGSNFQNPGSSAGPTGGVSGATTLGNTQLAYGPPAGVSGATFQPATEIQATLSGGGPYSMADAPTRKFRVVAQDPNIPCRLRYKTAETGTFIISDLDAFELSASLSSGKGVLQVNVPKGGESVIKQFIPVAFKNWKLEADPSSPDTWNVLDGSTTATVSPAVQFTVGATGNAGFPMTIKKATLSSTAFRIDGSLGLDKSKFPFVPSKGVPEAWSFTAMPINAKGAFSFNGGKTAAWVGKTDFGLDINSASIDFSGATKGTVCNTSGGFRGVRITGVLRSPAGLEFGGKNILDDINFDGWEVTTSGLFAKAGTSPAKTVTAGVVTVERGQVTIGGCIGGFDPKFALTFTGIPIVTAAVAAYASFDANGTLQVDLADPALSMKRTWPNAEATFSNFKITKGNGPNGWGVTYDSAFVLKRGGATFYEASIPAMKSQFSGAIFAQGFASNVSKKTLVGGFPFTITKLNVSNETQKKALKFILTGDLEVGDYVPIAKNRDVTFLVPYSGSAWLNHSGPTQVASLDGDWMPPGGGSSLGDDVEVQPVDVNVSFPEGSPVVTIKANCKYVKSNQGDGFKFTAKDGTLQVLGAGVDTANFVFGRANEGASFWMARAMVPLPSGIALGPSGLSLFAIGGGLGYNVPIGSFTADVETVDAEIPSTAGKKAYLFSAAADIATADKTTFFVRGTLAASIGDTVSARFSGPVWVLTPDHAGAGHGEICMQYYNGAFEAGASANLSMFLGLVSISAPGDPCFTSAVHMRYANTSDWHLYFGRKEEGQRVTVTAMGTTGEGAAGIDPVGGYFLEKVTVGKKYTKLIEDPLFGKDICTAFAEYTTWMELQGSINYAGGLSNMQLSASATAGLTVGAGCGVLSISAGGEVSLALTLPKDAQLCGSGKVWIHVIGEDFTMFEGTLCVP